MFFVKNNISIFKKIGIISLLFLDTFRMWRDDSEKFWESIQAKIEK